MIDTRKTWTLIWRSARQSGTAHRIKCNRREDQLAERAALAAIVRERAELTELPHWHPTRPGKPALCVAMVTNGMDCDCSSWSDRVTIVEAIPRHVERVIDDYYAGAEGPQGHYLAPPSTVAELETEYRDLALEAYEDGHAHVVYY